MIIHPELRALRDDDGPQRVAQGHLVAAAQAWREDPANAAILADLAAFATSRPLAECPALAALFEEGESQARTMALEFARDMVSALEQAPLGHLAMRHYADETLCTLLLAQAGNVSLALVATDGEGLAARATATTADFGPRESWESVLAGRAEAELIECRAIGEDGRADLRRRALSLVPGKVVCRDAARQSLQLRRVEGCLVSLRLQRRHERAGATREYALADGALVHQAAGNPRDSRVELMLAMLGRMGRADAAPMIASLALGDGSEGLRWQALRECLALDTATGFAALSALAVREADDLRGPAAALLDQLLGAHPQLAEIVPCPT